MHIVCFSVSLVDTYRALVCLVVESFTRAIFFSKKDAAMVMQ